LPYTKQNIPNGVKKLPDKAQDIFINAFNSAFKQYKEDEEKAFTTAWAAVEKAGYKKTDYTNTSKIYNGKTSLKASDNFYYLVSLTENKDNKLVEIMRTGKWKHPNYGNLEITNNTIDNIIMNFNDRIRGVDISIDLEHGESSYKGEAAGWIKKLEKKDGRLLADIDWTKLGEEKLKDKIYQYFSPEFKFVYQDAETGKKYNNVLFGGSLTNRPFIKNMSPVMLSEDININYCEYIKLNKKEDENNMNPELIKMLKLDEKATEEQIIETVNKLQESSIKLDELNESVKELTSKNSELNKQNETLTTKLSEATKSKSTVEKDNLILSEKVKNIESQLLNAEWEKVSSICLSEGKLTQKMLPVYEKSFKADPEATKEMIKVLEPVVDLSEKGSSTDNNKTNSQLFDEEVTKYMSENKVDYNQAIVAVERNNPELFKLFDAERRGVYNG
jgi:phage I-like protein/cation transport regulator ChaB